MYAIVKIGGSQFLVKEGERLTVPHLTAEPGTTVRLEDVLFVRTDAAALIGRPKVSDAFVEAEVIDQIRTDKVTIHKFIRRENYRRKKGHRQQMTRVKVTRINPGS